MLLQQPYPQVTINTADLVNCGVHDLATGKVKSWNADTGAMITRFTGHTRFVHAMLLSTTGKWSEGDRALPLSRQNSYRLDAPSESTDDPAAPA